MEFQIIFLNLSIKNLYSELRIDVLDFCPRKKGILESIIKATDLNLKKDEDIWTASL